MEQTLILMTNHFGDNILILFWGDLTTDDIEEI